jgi:UDP-N-acetylenolpyruvoylglucosamine reductase
LIVFCINKNLNRIRIGQTSTFFMPQKIDRKKFLKIALLTPMGIAIAPLQNLADTHLGNIAVSSTLESNVEYYKAGDAAYEVLRKGFSKRINKFPAVIALCKNANGVSEAINYAAKNNLPVAIKSGGHCMEGFSSNNGGMVINLSELKKIDWIDDETINVGPGCTLSELYNVLLPKKKIIPGGSCAGVGIGGLVLGGGYGLMSRKFGLTCDSLQAVTMVDGKGQIISSDNNTELLWANRGGNNGNFGVVTELIFKTQPAPTNMQSFRFRSYKVTVEKTERILKSWFELTANLPNDCFSAFVLNGKTVYILLTNVGKHTALLQTIISGLTAITERTTKTTALPLQQALKAYYGRQHPLYFKNASAGLYENFSSIEPFVNNVIDKVISTPGMIYQVNTLGGNIQNPEFEKVSAFPHRKYSYFSELQTYWDIPKQAVRLLEQFQQVQEIFTSNGIKTQYRNYPDINFTHWPEMYYGANYETLRQLKIKYDPGNLFRYEQSISGA